MVIVAQSTYDGVEIGLYDQSQLLYPAQINKKDACANLLPTLDMFMKKALCSFDNLDCIIVNKGPAPFTSLRTVIATINGIGFSKKIPLIGYNTFEVMMHEYDQKNTKTVLIVLNAYSKEYYYGFKKTGSTINMGVCTYDNLPPYSGQEEIHIIGHVNAISSEQLKQYTHPLIVSNHAYATLNGLISYNRLQMEINPTTTPLYHISPLYLKNHF